eukprot:TRINITY_DN5522_c0_g1_i3.p2 TRINITY_DN5522_c0_g1~~TRINITY_DN5522_c0_g1_i3.p2  ORF type:complete len:106 (-),score=31.77 TRINITY_DN5522_c0_g1_i3:439-756(-)
MKRQERKPSSGINAEYGSVQILDSHMDLTIDDILAEPDFFEIDDERAKKFMPADARIGFDIPEFPVDDSEDEELKEIFMRAEDIKDDPLQHLNLKDFVCFLGFSG